MKCRLILTILVFVLLVEATMTYSALPSVSTGDLWTAANHNTYLRDNLSDHESRILAVEAGVSTRTTVYRSTDQTLSNTTETSLIFSAALTDEDGMWSAGSPTILTVVNSGYYIIVASLSFAPSATGIRRTRIRINGADIAPDVRPGVATFNTDVNVSTAAYLTAGDTIDVLVYQNSGGNLNALANSPVLRSIYIGP